MILAVEPRRDRGLEVTSVLVSADDRDYVALLDPSAPCSDEILMICSWCKRIELAEEGWTDIERSVRTLGLFNESPIPRLSHSLCPRCEARTAVA